MKYKVFTNTKPGRTLIDEWTPQDDMTPRRLMSVYAGEYAKIDQYTNEGHFVASFFLSPDDWAFQPAEGTVMARVEG